MKKLTVILSILTVLFITGNTASQPATLWTKYYNNIFSNKNDIMAKSVTDNHGNTYVTGTTQVGIQIDIVTIKYDPAGNVKWTRGYNNAGVNDNDIAYDLCVDTWGNVFVSGYGVGLNSTLDGIVIGYDSTGTQKFVRRYNRTNIAERRAYGGKIITQGSYVYVACRFNYNDQFESGILKLSQNGDSITYRVLATQPGPGGIFIYGLAADNLGNVYVCDYGKHNVGEANDMGFYKLNNTMQNVWTKYYSGPSHGDDYPYDLEIGPDGNVFVCGSSFQNNQDHDFMLFKIGRDDGAVIWSKRINNSEANQSDYGAAIAFDNNANIIVGGSSNGLNTSADLLTVKFSPAGTILWQQRYNYNTTREDRFSDIACDGAGNAYVTGRSYRDGVNIMDLITLKYGSSGALDWSKIYQGTSAFDETNNINLDPQGNLIITGNLMGPTTELDMVIFKYATTIGIQPISGEVPSAFALSQNYPNPFNPVTNIKFSIPKSASVMLTVFDVSGRQVAELVNEQLSAGSYNFDFNASHLSSGVYFYKLVSNEFTDVKKMILVK